jgi:hypothetical protein
MSNRVEPVLNTVLPELPKTNVIIPLNIKSKSFDSFPPMATPKLQPLKIEVITYPSLRGISRKDIPVEKEEKIQATAAVEREPPVINKMILIIMTIFVGVISYTILSYLLKK